jgi:hypothetical protein
VEISVDFSLAREVRSVTAYKVNVDFSSADKMKGQQGFYRLDLQAGHQEGGG